MSHALAGARGTVPDRDAILRRAQEWAVERGAEVLLADAAAVFGRDHLESAALHAERARDEATMTLRSVSMEALLYLSGQRQVADAIRIAGLKDGTDTIAVLVFGEAMPDELLSSLGWSRDDTVLNPGGKDLRALGVGIAELGTIPEDRIADLALERTALVDVAK